MEQRMLDESMLANLLRHPDVQQRILGDYKGNYSLGITLNPDNQQELAIRVRIEGEDASHIRPYITLIGVRIPIIVITDFQPPQAIEVGHSS